MSQQRLERLNITGDCLYPFLSHQMSQATSLACANIGKGEVDRAFIYNSLPYIKDLVKEYSTMIFSTV